MTEHLLRDTLELAVPLWIQAVHTMSFEQRKARAEHAAQVIASHGDNILYKSKKRGETARAFNALAEAIAILSFQPGGVTFLGRHWEASHGQATSAHASGRGRVAGDDHA